MDTQGGSLIHNAPLSARVRSDRPGEAGEGICGMPVEHMAICLLRSTTGRSREAHS